MEIPPPEDADEGRSLHLLFHEPERLACALTAAVVAAGMERQPGPLRAPEAQGLHGIEAGIGLYYLMRGGLALEPEVEDDPESSYSQGPRPVAWMPHHPRFRTESRRNVENCCHFARAQAT